ncbi:TPA: hypothetical protein ACX3GX_001859 [Vibrio parahaemolyticus]
MHFVTIAFAPIRQFSPMTIPPMSFAPEPIYVFFFTLAMALSESKLLPMVTC